MKAIDFHEVRALQYEMLKVVDKFCRENNITYFLTYGTLLGAVRHKGFIPWDDDIDVMLPQPDLEKFCKLFKSNIYKVVSVHNDKSHNLVFPRLYDMRTFSKTGNIETYGVGIDLYGIYGLPTSPIKHRDFVFDFYKLWNKRIKLSGLRRRLALWKMWPSGNLNFGLLHIVTEAGLQLQCKCSYSKAYVCMIDTRPAMPFAKELLGTPVELEFEDGKFFAPQNYKHLLSLMYGDYMSLPPENQRVPYHGYDCYWK